MLALPALLLLSVTEPRETTPHLRLLVEIRGPLLDAAEFSHPRWQLVT